MHTVKQDVTSVHTFRVLGICRLSPFHLSAGWKYGKEIKEIPEKIVHMGQFLQDGENCHFVSFFF